MFPVVASDLNDYYAKIGRVFRAEIGTTIATATTGTFLVGIQTGSLPLRVLSRSYTSSESPLTVELFENDWTGGTSTGIRTLNRNLAVGGTPPATFLGGVTATLGAAITGATLRAATTGGTSALSVSSDDNVLVLKPNTKYVLRFTNGGQANAQVSAGIDFRNVQPEE
ncbi:hypothetical protein D3C78_1184110 [compost metagenome]